MRWLGAGLALALPLLGACAGEDPAGIRGGPGRGDLVRPDTPGSGLMFTFDASDVVETFGSTEGHFLVHFTRAGRNAVPTADVDASGVPDFVEEVASIYEDVLAHYTTLGFKPPIDDGDVAQNGGDARFDVYLVDFAGQGDGNFQTDPCTTSTCPGYMIEENDYAGYGYPSTTIANRILASHEFFHAIQAAYDVDQGAVAAEGSAVWGTESFDPTLNDFEGFIPGYLDNTDRPLDVPINGAADPFSYGTAIFFEFLEERYGDGTVRDLWERCVDGANGVADPIWFTQLGPLVAARGGTDFEDAMVEFATWNLFTGNGADPSRGYADGAGYARPVSEDAGLPYTEPELRMFHASTQYFTVFPGDRTVITAALVPPAGAPGEVDGLDLLVAPRTDGVIGEVVRFDDVTKPEIVPLGGANEVVVYVVNGLQADPSKKPGLCIGSPEEVDACIAALSASGAGGGGGSGGAPVGATTGAGASPVADETDPSESSCGCHVVGDDDGPVGVVALALVALATRRRRR